MKYYHKFNLIGGNISIKAGSEILVLNQSEQSKLETKINLSTQFDRTRQGEIGDFLYYNTIGVLEVTPEEFKILYNLHNGINSDSVEIGAASSVESDIISDSISSEIRSDEIRSDEIVPFIDVNYIIHGRTNINVIESLNHLINILNLRNGYLINDKDWNTRRLSELDAFFKKNKIVDTTDILLFNKEKLSIIDIYRNLNEMYNMFTTYYINNIVLEQDLHLTSYRSSMGKININDKTYMYKVFNQIPFNTTLKSLDEFYNFIYNCNTLYFHDDFDDYIITMVQIPMICVFSKNHKYITCGYLMDIVEGDTVRDIITNYPFYWDENKILIKTAILSLIGKLSSINYIITDFAYDNIMWNMETNTLTFIDIGNNFNKPNASDVNSDVYYGVEFDKIY